MMRERWTSTVRELKQLRTLAVLKGADLTLRVPALRSWFIDRRLDRLETAYDETTPHWGEQLGHVRWLGTTLRCLRNEPPGAASWKAKVPHLEPFPAVDRASAKSDRQAAVV